MSLKDKFVNMLASFADDQIPGEPEIHGEKQISPRFLGQEKTILEMMLDAPESHNSLFDDGYLNHGMPGVNIHLGRYYADFDS